VVIFLGSGFFQVGTQEKAIILRFGKTVGQGQEALLGPGLHWSFPYPSDELVRIPITEIQKVVSTIGWFAETPEQELSGNLPPKGAVLAPDRALCNEFPRQVTRPEKLTLKEFKRPQDVVIDEQICMLAQGVVCLGPATRSGCEALCPQGNMPCTGCFGPTSRVRDYGAKALSAIASIIDSNDEAEIEQIVQTVPDPVGTFYRYSLPTSMLRRKREI